MPRVINCSFCGNKITRDRYNIAHVLERQDSPPNGDWQKSIDSYKEDVCPNCQRLITAHYDNFCNYLRENKGILK
ncbi:MAG: hypothetical protein HeimC3_26100 [Candidatus Heimdallarchaeota archaeon LC_3]|nr:MAG: hypothetical protein HeimC3_26100 [Candidatus Heimdallarchaeota archaeon LC_3]